MDLSVVGQRCISEREPELGLGIVAAVDEGTRRVSIAFPATSENRLYALGTSVLKRVRFRVGDNVTTRDRRTFRIEQVNERGGLLEYFGEGQTVSEDSVSDSTSVTAPLARLLAGQVDSNEVFDLRWRALRLQAQLRESEVRGFLGGRVELIPHQFYILHEMATRQTPRVLLADEVGLGKTIEACLIIQRLLAVGQVRRVLILVPEPLTHQWFVELLRRFELWFTIFDAERCTALEESAPAENPFLSSQLALANVSFLASDEARRAQVLAADWDLVVVDEAHHLVWTPEHASYEYQFVEVLARQSPGLLLLTATPTQLGQAGHFARLRLLDPDRYSNYEQFVAESERFAVVAAVAEKIVESWVLTARDRATLQRIFSRDPERLAAHLDALKSGAVGARESLLRTLLDQYGTGRVMFRNTRAAMPGFPRRCFEPVPLPSSGSGAQVVRIARELQAEETGNDGALRYSYKEDPRIDWLADFLRKSGTTKVLLICKTTRKVLAIEAALQERIKARSAVFHEGLALVQRDRNAAWFAEPDGAQLLLCSEIGSEGRNFQFAHQLVLFDLPLDPGLVEQRIGRLDRIGQTQAIRIYVPYVVGTADECVVEWYRRGVAAFEHPLHGGEEYRSAFRSRLLELAADYGGGAQEAKVRLESLIAETAEFRSALVEKLRRGRDRLLELASFEPVVAAEVIERVRSAEADVTLRRFLVALLDHFGVRIKDHEEGDVFLDPSHAYIESFPSIPADGMLATFDRRRAIVREDIRFLSADHPLVRDATDLLIDSPSGTTAFGLLAGPKPNLLLEAVFVLEAMADSRWQVDRFLAPTPIRVVVDARGRDLTAEREVTAFAGNLDDADLHRFLDHPAFEPAALTLMLTAASALAESRALTTKSQAAKRAGDVLRSEYDRLIALQKVNDHIRKDEVERADARVSEVGKAIDEARLRLDSLRLVLEGPMAD